jgi:hypothetical protein
MRRLIPLLALVAGLGLVGCQDKPTTGPPPATTTATRSAHKHAGWWCREHGIPEHECLMCLHSEEELKKKGDWCEKHEYAKSQCFGGNPKLRERYAALYRDKYGKEPPEADENPAKPDEEPARKDEPGKKDKK